MKIMQKKLFFFIIAYCICCFIACKKDRCDSTKVGESQLDIESKRFVPYEMDEVITFMNSQGETMQFTVSRELSTSNRSCVKYLCEAFADPFQPTPCEYYETESVRNILRSDNDSILIDILVSIENYEEESTLFYEIFSIYMSEIGSLADGKFVSHVQFDTPVFDINEVNIQNLLIEKSEIELLGQTFSDVLQTKEAENMVFYKKDVGMIALKLDGDIWLLTF